MIYLMTKFEKLSSGVGLATILLFASSSSVFAQTTINPCAGAGADFYQTLCALSTTQLPTLVQRIIVILLIFAVLISLFFLIFGGIKWILSGGDKTGVETARNMIIAAIVGLVIAFLAFFILNVVLGLFGLGFDNLKLPRLTN